MGSSRLPGKVLEPLAGEPMLVRDVRRLRRAKTLGAVVVATTVEPQDDAIVALAEGAGWPVSRGSEDDVLDRYVQAAREHDADVVVRVTSDCPLISPDVVDRVVRTLLDAGPPGAEGGADLASNVVPRHTWPRGLDAEAVWRTSLERAWREDDDPAWREHVTFYIKQHPDRFRLVSVQNDEDLSALRWTVDTPEDLAFARAVYDHFGHDRFTWREVLAAQRERPEWTALNADVRQKEVRLGH